MSSHHTQCCCCENITDTVTHDHNLYWEYLGLDIRHSTALRSWIPPPLCLLKNGLYAIYIIMFPHWFNGLKQQQSKSFSQKHLGPKVGVEIAERDLSEASRTSTKCEETTVSKQRNQTKPSVKPSSCFSLWPDKRNSMPLSGGKYFLPQSLEFFYTKVLYMLNNTYRHKKVSTTIKRKQ